MAQDVPSADKSKARIGAHSRVAGVGQEYEVIDIIDDATAVIFAKRYKECVPYPIAEIEADLAGIMGVARYGKLVGQVRSIGPDGPKYEVVSVNENGGAQIWIIPNDGNDPYDVADILLDPFAD
jgi:hypothetical protein